MGWSKNPTADTKAQSAPTLRCLCWDTDIKDEILMLTPFKRSQINSLRLTMSASVGTRFISVAAQDHLQWEAIFLRIHLIKIHFLSQVQNSSEHFKKLFHEEFFMKLFLRFRWGRFCEMCWTCEGKSSFSGSSGQLFIVSLSWSSEIIWSSGWSAVNIIKT